MYEIAKPVGLFDKACVSSALDKDIGSFLRIGMASLITCKYVTVPAAYFMIKYLSQ